MATVTELTSEVKSNWCPGCGDWVILSTMRNVISELGLEPSEVVIVTGIGCGSKLNHYIKTYGFEGLHGRILPVATAIRLANTGLKVIAIGGDGDGYGIGGNHFMHAMRRNLDITYIIQNNEVYGLTKGQYSPTSKVGMKTPSSPNGALETPVNPMTWAIAAGATFVARSYSMDLAHSKEVIKQAIQHKGFSLVDVLQLCPSYNKAQDMKWYQERIRKLPADYNPTDKALAFAKALEEAPINVGVFYKEEGKPTYEDGIPQIAQTPLVKQPIENIDIGPLLEKFK